MARKFQLLEIVSKSNRPFFFILNNAGTVLFKKFKAQKTKTVRIQKKLRYNGKRVISESGVNIIQFENFSN